MMYDDQFRAYTKQVDEFLPGYLPDAESLPGRLHEAMSYSLLADGKRIRPVLSLATAELLKPGAAEEKAVQTYAAAVEMVHTYSLIHDDLPSMDDDVLRRGKPTSHVVFGEALAILAGDALLTRAFELAQEAAAAGDGSEGQASAILACWGQLARFAGASGMIGGQVLDMEAEDRKVDLEYLRKMQEGKTSALLQAAVLGAAELMGASLAVKNILSEYALAIGLAFQIRDDILDATATADEIGKTPGKDQVNHKSTYVTLLGLEQAEEHLGISSRQALTACGKLTNMGYDADFLAWLAGHLSGRRN